MKPETWKATEAKKKSTEEKSAWNISWHFKPGQPQRITSGLKTMFNLSPFLFF